MKTTVTALLAVLIIAFAHTSANSGQPVSNDSDAAMSVSPSGSVKQQTIRGRIVRLNTKSGLISVRAGDTGKVLELSVAKDIVVGLRKGERVVILYSGKTVKKIEATRSER